MTAVLNRSALNQEPDPDPTGHQVDLVDYQVRIRIRPDATFQDPGGFNISGSGLDPDPAGFENSGSGAPEVLVSKCIRYVAPAYPQEISELGGRRSGSESTLMYARTKSTDINQTAKFCILGSHSV